MKVLRKVCQFELNEGSGSANGLYNITNEILLEHTKEEGVSFWFDEETKDHLLNLSETDFIERAKQMAGNDIYSFEVGKSVWNEITNLDYDNKMCLKEIWKTDFGRTFYKGDSQNEIVNWFLRNFKKNQ